MSVFHVDRDYASWESSSKGNSRKNGSATSQVEKLWPGTTSVLTLQHKFSIIWELSASISIKQSCVCVCLSVTELLTELFKRRGRGVALATHAVASRDAGLSPYLCTQIVSFFLQQFRLLRASWIWIGWEETLQFVLLRARVCRSWLCWRSARQIRRRCEEDQELERRTPSAGRNLVKSLSRRAVHISLGLQAIEIAPLAEWRSETVHGRISSDRRSSDGLTTGESQQIICGRP